MGLVYFYHHKIVAIFKLGYCESDHDTNTSRARARAAAIVREAERAAAAMHERAEKERMEREKRGPAANPAAMAALTRVNAALVSRNKQLEREVAELKSERNKEGQVSLSQAAWDEREQVLVSKFTMIISRLQRELGKQNEIIDKLRQ